MILCNQFEVTALRPWAVRDQTAAERTWCFAARLRDSTRYPERVSRDYLNTPLGETR